MPRKSLTVSIPSPGVLSTHDMDILREDTCALFHAVQDGRKDVLWHLLRVCAVDPTGHLPFHARPEGRLAFAMAMHKRLGSDSAASLLSPELLQLVLSACIDRSDLLSTERGVRRVQGPRPADTRELLAWLEALKDAEPVHADANDAAARRCASAAMECKKCLNSKDRCKALALVPCGHCVCKGCWSKFGDAHPNCPECRQPVLHAVAPETFPPQHPLLVGESL